MFIKEENVPLYKFEDFLSDEESKRFFDICKENIKWSHDIYNFGGKEVKSPRLTAFFGETTYTYTGQTKIPQKYFEELTFLQNKIEEFLGIEKGFFNGCLCNWYRDGKDYISYHTDNEKDMIDEGIIAVVSLGTNRKFYIKNNNTKEVIKNNLEIGSLGVMNPICQKNWKHSIPKEAKVEDSRISLTFRNFKKLNIDTPIKRKKTLEF